MDNKVTVVAVTVIACGSLWFLGTEGKEIVLAAVSGLIGYLTGKSTNT